MADPATIRRRLWLRPWLLALGLLLLAVTPLVGVVPGPGGVFVFAAGMALVLRNSRLAKKLYVRFARRWPKAGEWSDWAMRRPSYLRRREAGRTLT